MLVWEKSCKLFEKWMNKTLKIKKEGDDKNSICKGSGEALRNFGKLLGNGTYGQMIRRVFNDVIEFINNVDDQRKFLQNNDTREIIENEEDIDGYHVFIGDRKTDETKDLTSRSRFLGSFILSYSRMMLDEIINCIYGENRFKKEFIKNQVYLGDTDSIVIHSSLIEKLEKAGFIGDVNGKLTDDLNKNLLSNGYAKILKLTAPAPKKYSLQYMLPDGSIKEKTKCNGIAQRNMKFINPLTGAE